MGDKPVVLIVDDNVKNVQILKTRLSAEGYATVEAYDGQEALEKISRSEPDLILLDIMMPKIDGFEVLRRLKSRKETRGIPVIMITARSETEDVVRGFDAGADEYLTKPFHQMELMARVRSSLRMASYQRSLAETNSRLEELNRSLEDRVARQVQELERINKIKRYLSPQLVHAVLESDGEIGARVVRREVTIFFSDLRGFTEFSDSVEPEEMILLLNNYHREMGVFIFKYEGTLERFAGDSIMVFFGAPLAVEDHTERAIRMSLEMREKVKGLRKGWQKVGYELDVGIGVCAGYATVGNIGFEGRMDYAAIGNVTNLASRLCSIADGGEILLNQRTLAKVEHLLDVEMKAEMEIKGLRRPIKLFNVLGLKEKG